MFPTLVLGQGELSSYGRLCCWPESELGWSLKARMNQGITDEGTPEVGARMTSDGEELNLTTGKPSGEVLLTADEVAQILRVPRSWVYSHLSVLPVIRLGRYVRFRRSEINGFLEKRGACQ
jgi:excisionase family DNA binding protein